MAIPLKGSRQINHHDILYRYLIKSTGRYSELQVELSEAVEGQLLIVEAPKVFHMDYLIESIDFANKNGWKKAETARPFRCRYTRKGFVIQEEI